MMGHGEPHAKANTQYTRSRAISIKVALLMALAYLVMSSERPRSLKERSRANRHARIHSRPWMT